MSEFLQTYFPVDKVKILKEVLKETLQTNKKFNLTAITNEKEFEEKMILDSALILKYVTLKGKKVIDIGTGAGFPGLILSILEDNDIDLLDSTKKKIDYLNILKEKYGFKINPICERAEKYSASHRDTYDFAVARSVANLKVLVEIIIPLLKIGGTLICYKGPNYQTEIDESKSFIKNIGSQITRIEETTLPNGEKRAFIFITKVKKNSLKYPRDYKEIVK